MGIWGPTDAPNYMPDPAFAEPPKGISALLSQLEELRSPGLCLWGCLKDPHTFTLLGAPLQALCWGPAPLHYFSLVKINTTNENTMNRGLIRINPAVLCVVFRPAAPLPTTPELEGRALLASFFFFFFSG